MNASDYSTTLKWLARAAPLFGLAVFWPCLLGIMVTAIAVLIALVGISILLNLL